LVYDTKGDSSLANTVLELNSQFGIGNLDPQPILLADPTSDKVALVVNAGGSALLVLEGAQGNLNMHQVNVSPSTADAATYMVAPVPPANTQPQPIQVLIGSGEFVLGTFFTSPPNPQPKCKLTDGGTSIQPRALGAFRNGMVDDVVAWGANGKL